MAKTINNYKFNKVRFQESLYSKMISVPKFSTIQIQLQFQIATDKMKQYESSKNFRAIENVLTVGSLKQRVFTLAEICSSWQHFREFLELLHNSDEQSHRTNWETIREESSVKISAWSNRILPSDRQNIFFVKDDCKQNLFFSTSLTLSF